MSNPTQTSSNGDQAVGEREEAARRYVEQLRAFYVHASLFVVGMLIMSAVNLVTNLWAGVAGQWSAWWSVWALLGWGIGIAVHGFVVWLNRPSFAPSTWEQRRIDRLLGR